MRGFATPTARAKPHWEWSGREGGAACTIAARAFEAVALDCERGFESAGRLTLRFSPGEGQLRFGHGPVRIDA